MTSSELHRKLLYCGYDDMADYLRNSPFNRCIYNIVVEFGLYSGIDTPMVEIFNEAYYQCVHVNYDSDPGVNIEKRYLKEEEVWLGSFDAAKFVFGIVWGFLRCKDARTFNEKCFVDHYWPLVREWHDEELSYVIIKFTAGDRVFPPRKFRPMPCPVSELASSYTDDDSEAWKEVTNNFSQKTIERYLEIYEKVEDQHTLLDLIEHAYQASGSKNLRVSFTKLREAIANGDFHQAADDIAQYEEGMDLSYKEELDELKKEFEKLKDNHEYEKNRMKHRFNYELEKLREKLEQVSLDKIRDNDPSVLLFSFSEMVEIVKARFSKTAADEFSNMLYTLATKHGYLDEEICETIDGIVPAILQRDAHHQTINIPTAQQVNINPKEVINTPKEE